MSLTTDDRHADAAIARALGHSGRRIYRALPAIGALAGIAIGGSVLVGWAVGSAAPARGLAGPALTLPNSAAALLLLGTALWLLRPRGGASRSAPPHAALAGARAAAGVATLVAALIGLEWVTGRDLGIDHV
ncbi:MAG TPA: hypothetical protein VGD56_03550, partial [Gemmatirosa sp.]